jgi:MFS family permease
MGLTENDRSDLRVGEKLAEIRRRRAWMNAVLLMSIPLGFLLGVLAALIGERSPLWLALLVFIWAAIPIAFVVRVASVRCPFCGKRFFERTPFPDLWSRRCRNCKVPLDSHVS